MKRDKVRKGIFASMVWNLSSSVNGWNNALGRRVSSFSCQSKLLRCTELYKSRFQAAPFHSSTQCFLNRFLFSSDELEEVSANFTNAVVKLAKDDYRTIHAAKILNLHNGDTVRAGIVSSDSHDGLLTDQAVIEWLPEGNVKKAEPFARSKEPPGSLRLYLKNLQNANSSSISSLPPSVSLILALPRPLQLGRMLPMISQMGVKHLVLTTARKVPRDYFGSHLFRRPEVLTERLIEGLCQAGDVRLPKVHVVRHLPKFLENELDTHFPPGEYARVIAHPKRMNQIHNPSIAKRLGQVSFPSLPAKMLIAVGPEGGWDEPEELDHFILGHSFEQITMGCRVLRSDCAVVSLLALAHDACEHANDVLTIR